MHEAENTVPAFGSAVAAGADVVEFDVRMTADGVATRARWTITPGLGTEAMFRGLAAASAGGRLAQLRVLARHRDEMRLASPPDVVQRVLLGVVRLLPGG